MRGGIVTCFENIATLGLFLRNDNLSQSVDCLIEAFLILQDFFRELYR